MYRVGSIVGNRAYKGHRDVPKAVKIAREASFGVSKPSQIRANSRCTPKAGVRKYRIANLSHRGVPKREGLHRQARRRHLRMIAQRMHWARDQHNMSRLWVNVGERAKLQSGVLDHLEDVRRNKVVFANGSTNHHQAVTRDREVGRAVVQ